MKNLRSRLLKGLGANAFGQLASIVIQVISVPVFLQAWGVELYGEWLILSTVPAYFAMSDVGFANVAANEMTMLVAKGERDKALEIFQSTWLFISFTCCSIFGVLLLSVGNLPLEHWLNLHHQTRQTVSVIFLLFTLHILVKLQSGLLEAGFRCDGNYALGVFSTNIVRLFENLAILAAVLAGGSFIEAALVFVGFRGVGFVLMRLKLRQLSPWIRYGVGRAKLTTIKRLVNPAMAFMGFPLGYALINQGLYTVVAVALNPAAVVVFSALRTISRLAFQVMVMVNSTVWPEISAAYGTGDLPLARALHHYSCKFSIWLSGAVVVLLAFWGEQILTVWTQGKVVMDFDVFYIMLAVIVVNSTWLTSSVVPSATNRHQKVAVCFVFSTISAVALACILTPRLGLPGTALSMLLADLVMMVFVVRTSLTLLQDDFSSFLHQVISLPDVKGLLKGLT